MIQVGLLELHVFSIVVSTGMVQRLVVVIECQYLLSHTRQYFGAVASATSRV